MKTMPRISLRLMRFLTERMMTWISKWEDQHGDERDYRMSHLNSGLHQASQSMREILTGEYNPMRYNTMRKNDEVGTTGKPWKTNQRMGERYAAELLSHVPIPMRPVD